MTVDQLFEGHWSLALSWSVFLDIPPKTHFEHLKSAHYDSIVREYEDEILGDEDGNRYDQ